jgi:alpha-glucosidase
MRSSILTFIETPPNLLANESSSFIARVPSVWDETIVLPPSKIGEVAVFARRSGEDWFVAVQNANKGERSIEIDLSFLPDHKTFQIEQYYDVLDNPADLKKEISNVTSRDKLIIPMRSGGGYAAMITNRE